MKKLTLIFLIFQIYSTIAASAPKYGPNTVPLSAKEKVEYFKQNSSPDFWALMPYYVGQDNDSSCSAATLTTILNGVRNATELTQEDELVTQNSLREKFTDDQYRYNTCGDPALAIQHGIMRLGVTVERLSEVLKTAMDKLKLLNKKTVIQIYEIDQKNLETSKKKFHELLVKNEKSSNDFIIINFTQGVLTGDGAGMIGHIAAVAAYDSKNKRVLILDPDRKWYEPYWSPEAKVFEAIADKKSDPKPGYIYFKFR